LPWLEADQPLREAPVVVVLNGENQRADEAAAIFSRVRAQEIWLTNDPRSGSATIADAGTDDNRARLNGHGIPSDVVRVLPASASGTKAELRQVGQELAARGFSHAIVVTSKVHGRRTRALWRCVVGDRPTAVIHSSANTDYVGSAVVWKELLRLPAAWMCLG
jgi:uncharacterized SAM-binding protein YcdF (DUF218 family)